jgi:(1->4)-alpha-D-glucan 1-alpha-D-glucosylmutase
MAEEEAAAPDIAAIAQEVLARRHIPRATYRLQLNSSFRFRDVQALIPYWHDLGISDLYVSPILQACAGSTHGYDVCEYNRINSELGGEKDLADLSAALSQHGMGLILDVVPNHMGISDARNAWWMDVLENGPSSLYASYFDIDWNPVKAELKDKILLPILEDQYGKVLEAGKLKLVYEGGSFFILHYRTQLPVAPRTYSKILAYKLGELSESMGSDDPNLQELQSILTALNYLPSRTEQDFEKIAERTREKEVIKRRIGALYETSSVIREAIESTVAEFNGVVGDPHSFDNLDELLSMQVYRPAFWKVAAEEINYRRFFDVNDLAAIRMEGPEVFKAAHALVFELLSNGTVRGLRIDHADGLWDPAAYLRQIQYGHLWRSIEPRLPPDAAMPESEAALSEWLAGGNPAKRWPVYVVVEKVLSQGEPLPQEWATYGTTGYDFLNRVNGLFVDSTRKDTSTGVYTRFIGRQIRYDDLINSTKKMIMLVSLASEIYALSHQLDRISEGNRRYRDFTLDTLTFAVREIIASLGIYRTYITGPEPVSQRDRTYIEAAVADVKRRNPRTAESLFDFVSDTLLLRNLESFHDSERTTLINWVMKFQQITGPVMAKGSEDTAFYVFNRLISLNEVGGDPGHFGTSIAAFHRHNEEHCRRWPYSMLAGTTHDTKRSEDVRARINVLSEVPGEWAGRLERWRKMNAGKKMLVNGKPAPDPNDEYFFYQTLLGAWPPDASGQQLGFSAEGATRFSERIAAYMNKATKEAKVHTSWVNPHRDYDQAVRGFVLKVLGKEEQNAFLDDFLSFQRRIAYYGKFNALSQLLLKLTCPGVPDTYQGSEFWDLRLVDPDNRGPVDYAIRISYLHDLKDRVQRSEREQAKECPLKDLAMELLQTSDDGRIKLYVIYRTLNFRRSHPELFSAAGYMPLHAIGIKKRNVCSFSRELGSSAVIVSVPRLLVELTDGMERAPLNEEIWQDTWLVLPDGKLDCRYRNFFTGEMLRVQKRKGVTGLPLSAVFGCFPVAFLELMKSDQNPFPKAGNSSTTQELPTH